MPVRRCILNGKNVHSLNDLYDQLSQLSLPEHFGRNLDALWDTLSTDVEGPFEIVWKYSEQSKKLMGQDFDRVVKMLKELRRQRDDFILKIEK